MLAKRWDASRNQDFAATMGDVVRRAQIEPRIDNWKLRNCEMRETYLQTHPKKPLMVQNVRCRCKREARKVPLAMQVRLDVKIAWGRAVC